MLENRIILWLLHILWNFESLALFEKKVSRTTNQIQKLTCFCAIRGLILEETKDFVIADCIPPSNVNVFSWTLEGYHRVVSNWQSRPSRNIPPTSRTELFLCAIFCKLIIQNDLNHCVSSSVLPKAFEEAAAKMILFEISISWNSKRKERAFNFFFTVNIEMYI